MEYGDLGTKRALGRGAKYRVKQKMVVAMKAIINGKIITEHLPLEGKTLLYEEKIIDIIDDESLNADYTRIL